MNTRVKLLVLFVSLLVCCGSAFAQQHPTAKPDVFAKLRWLAGTWKGPQSGEPGNGSSERTYEFVLGGKFLQVRNKSTYPPQEKNKAGETHEDMGMMGYDNTRKRLVFRQFHQEGFVNTYVEEPGGGDASLVFVTESIENIPNGWRARETYLLVTTNDLVEQFELAKPGKDFEVYSTARLKRVR